MGIHLLIETYPRTETVQLNTEINIGLWFLHYCVIQVYKFGLKSAYRLTNNIIYVSAKF